MTALKSKRWGPLEYVLLIILVFLLVFTVLSLFWPALQLFYQSHVK